MTIYFTTRLHKNQKSRKNNEVASKIKISIAFLLSELNCLSRIYRQYNANKNVMYDEDMAHIYGLILSILSCPFWRSDRLNQLIVQYQKQNPGHRKPITAISIHFRRIGIKPGNRKLEGCNVFLQRCVVKNTTETISKEKDEPASILKITTVWQSFRRRLILHGLRE